MKKTNKRWLAVLLTVLLLFGTVATGLSAAAEGETTIIDQGYCGGEGDGTNLTWTFYDDGTLIISGEGAMREYDRYSRNGRTPSPWQGSIVPVIHLVVNPGVTSIGEFAFDDCQELTDVVLPESLARIGYFGLANCHALSSVDLPDGLTKIGAYAFANSGLTQLAIPDSVTEIGSDAFFLCKSLAEVHFGSGLSDLPSEAFSYCESLESVVIPDNITGDCAGAFSECRNLKNVTLSKNMERIGAYMFRFCAMESIDFPESVKYIDKNAFEGCANIKSFTIPEGVSSIALYTFYHCSGLETVIIPQSVKSIESSAFDGCDNLKDVYYGGSARQWNLLPLGNNNDDELLNCTIHFGDTQDELVWSIEDGVMTVNGEGPIIPDLVDATDRRWNAETQTWVTSTYHSIQTTFPWSVTEFSFPEFDEEGYLIFGEYDGRVKTIIIGEGITEICDSAFCNYDPATIVLPSTLERIPREFTHPHRPYSHLVSYSAFNTSSLKDLYILNPDADMGDFSIKIRTRTPGAADYTDDFYSWYMEYIKAMVTEEFTGYLAAALTGYTGDSVLFKYYAAKHGAAVYDFHYGTNEDKRRDLDIRPEGADAYIAGLLENDQDVWEYLGIPYDDTDAFEAAIVAYVNRSLGTDFASIDDMYVLQDPITEGGKPEAANSEALAAAVEAEEARLIAIQTEYGVLPDESAGTETEPQGEYYLGDPPETEKDGETIALTPPQDLYIHGYAGSTAEEAAAISGLKFVPVCPTDYTHNVVETAAVDATSATAGYTSGWYCEDCGVYLTGHKLITPTADIWGYCGGEGDGTNLVWTLDSEGTLTISGTGAMANYSDSEPAPWNDYFAAPGASITVVLKEGVTAIGTKAFPNTGFNELIVLNKQCDLDALEIRDPAMLRGYLESTAKDYADKYDKLSTFKPLCNVDYRHTVEVIEGVDSTCMEPGHTPGLHCVECNNDFYGCEALPLENHAWGDWVTTKQPTTETEGVRTRTCTTPGCGETETQTIEKLTPTDNGGNDNNDSNDNGGGFFGWLQQAMKGLVAWFKKLLQFFK